MRGTIRGAAACACMALLAGTAAAQEVLHTFVGGGSAGNGLGHSVRAAGDVNGDGMADVITGLRMGSSVNGVNSGSACVWSGADGSLLHTFHGDAANDQLGRSVDGAGDVNGDGYADLIVGAAGHDGNGTDSGSARVFSGADGSLLYSIDGPYARSRFGWAVAGVGDVDGDGRADFAASGQPDNFVPQPIGYVRVFSGATGALIREIVGPVGTSRLGASLAGAGDVDGDGVEDLVAGDWRDATAGNASGAVRVYSGADGSQLMAFFGDKSNDRLGSSVDGVGDVNGDGHADLISGSPFANGAMFATGLVRVWSGADGALLYALEGDYPLDYFGGSVGGAGDVDGDGLDDFLVGAFADDDGGTDAGRATIYSGADGGILFVLDGVAPAGELGFAVAGVGDADGDGGLDFAVGAPAENAGGGSFSGSVRVYRGVPSQSASMVRSYCTTSANSVGAGAVLSWSGTTSFAANDLELTLSGGPPQGVALFFYGAGQTQVPMHHGVLCVAPPIQRMPPLVHIGPDGTASRVLDLQRAGERRSQACIAPGSTWNFQVVYLDPGQRGGRRLNLSDALEATFVP